MKTTKGGKVMNPTDAYRKELRKKEIKRNKKERKKVREVGILKKDPEAIKDQIQKLEVMQADGALDKARKHKKRQLEDTLNLVMKKRKEYEDKMREKGEEPVMFSHLGPPRRRTAEEEERGKHLKPEDSVYYHPMLNPTGAPPPGKPPMYKSSIGPRIPLPTSASGIGSSSNTETEGALAMPPPPPPPLPASGEQTSVDGSDLLSSIPLPPPPPAPPRLVESASSSVSLGSAPLPGLPAKESVASSSLLPPPPPPLQHLPPPPPPPPPGINVKESENSKSAATEGSSLNDLNRVTSVLPPPPPPPGLPPKPASQQSDIVMSESSFHNASINSANSAMPTLLPPPPRGPPPMPQRIPMMMHPLQPEVLPPGMVHYPPPPDSRPPMMVPGIPSRPLPPPPPPGMVPPSVMMPPFGPPPGPPGFLRPPAIPIQDDDIAARPLAPQKPSYIKSAASTVIKRPLAQHTPELTAMVPASVRVRRESVVPKAKPKPQTSIAALAPRLSTPSAVKSDTSTSSAAPKPQSIDDSYMAFLEDMKELGALEG